MAEFDERRIRDRSLWLDGLPESIAPRRAVEGTVDADVVVVGAGFTGLWTAYYLACADPSRRVVVVEREVAAFGPSGRNGGWASAYIAGDPKVYAGRSGTEAVRRAEWATIEAVDEIGRVAANEGIDAAFAKRGALTIAYTEPQQARLIAGYQAKRTRGLGDDVLRILTPTDLAELVHTPAARAATFTPHAARIDPARLARGLAEACERRGVTIFEGSPATIGEGRVTTPGGEVRAPMIVRATESFSIQAAGWKRRFLPLYSLMVATEPLPAVVWDELGWPEGLAISDAHHLFFYAQRTVDGRIAIGGRGAPYRLGSPIAEANERNGAVRARLIGSIRRHFPAAADAAITHHWGGPLAVPSDWSMSITCDHATGQAWAGGYSGHGVVAANISGRTLADLILERSSELTAMPWVGHVARHWEPEPIRFVASRAIVGVLGSADRHEDATGRTARRTRLVAPFVLGR